MYSIKCGSKLLQVFVTARYATKMKSSSNVSRFSMCNSSKDRVQMVRASFERMKFYFKEKMNQKDKSIGICKERYSFDFPWCPQNRKRALFVK